MTKQEELLNSVEEVDVSDLKELLGIFVSEKTCAEREKAIVSAIQQSTETDKQINETLASLQGVMSNMMDTDAKQETRIAVLEEEKKGAQWRSTMRISIIVLIVGILSNLKAIGSMIKTLLP